MRPDYTPFALHTQRGAAPEPSHEPRATIVTFDPAHIGVALGLGFDVVSA